MWRFHAWFCATPMYGHLYIHFISYSTPYNTLSQPTHSLISFLHELHPHHHPKLILQVIHICDLHSLHGDRWSFKSLCSFRENWSSPSLLSNPFINLMIKHQVELTQLHISYNHKWGRRLGVVFGSFASIVSKILR